MDDDEPEVDRIVEAMVVSDDERVTRAPSTFDDDDDDDGDGLEDDRPKDWRVDTVRIDRVERDVDDCREGSIREVIVVGERVGNDGVDDRCWSGSNPGVIHHRPIEAFDYEDDQRMRMIDNQNRHSGRSRIDGRSEGSIGVG